MHFLSLHLHCHQYTLLSIVTSQLVVIVNSKNFLPQDRCIGICFSDVPCAIIQWTWDKTQWI